MDFILFFNSFIIYYTSREIYKCMYVIVRERMIVFSLKFECRRGGGNLD